MKFGGYSYNGSQRHKQGVRTRCKCSICGRDYKMEDKRNIHERLCRENKLSK